MVQTHMIAFFCPFLLVFCFVFIVLDLTTPF
uniref:Uncharacterized protein n=1 Tax=Rhizophora mucronata TaxID=61149 RepID=A0A2P2NRP8_RHIMU